MYYKDVLAIFRNHPREAFNYKQLAHRIESNNANVRSDVMKILEILEIEDVIEQTSRGKYRYVPNYSIFTGVADFTARGVAFVYNEELDQDIRVSPALTGRAFNGDTVTVELVTQKRGKQPEGRIIEVVERSRSEFVGTVERLKNFAFIIPDNSKIHVDFFVPNKLLKGAKDGQKVLLEFTDWPESADNPFGRVIEILGNAGEHETEMHAIINEFGFSTKFDPRAEKEANGYPDKISDTEIKRRKDLRDILTFTIDPLDAKDFDDAISFREIDNKTVEIGVHIADVSHYVYPGSYLDKEALERATSVYLVDRTVPMLPERLSNNLCSLRPNEDKLAFSVVFTMDKKTARVKDYWLGKTIIHSDRRFTYEEAQEVIEGKSEELKDPIICLNEMAYVLKDRRFSEGAISFESDEFRFKLDEDGKPLEVFKKVRFDAHKLIEEYMLLANRTVAKHVFDSYKGKPLPYRVHESPNLEKMIYFIKTAKKFGHIIQTSDEKSIAHSINAMVEATEGKLEASILHPLAIRSMEKAFYTTKETSHFGLGFEYYTHFTSPIRRYPDLIVHRQLHNYLQGKMNADQGEIEKACHQSSKQEVKAVKAERASTKFKQTEYLSQFIGQEFDGMISGVTEWGVYVELLDNHCEGMVRIKDISGDFYEYYEEELSVVGRRTKKRYTFGDMVRIKIKKTNLHKRTVDFLLLRD